MGTWDETLGNVPFDISDYDNDEFVCPTCSKQCQERFYGPCEACRTELRAKFVREGVAAPAEKYEPKMNVTPNAVATKE